MYFCLAECKLCYVVADMFLSPDAFFNKNSENWLLKISTQIYALNAQSNSDPKLCVIIMNAWIC